MADSRRRSGGVGARAAGPAGRSRTAHPNWQCRPADHPRRADVVTSGPNADEHLRGSCPMMSGAPITSRTELVTLVENDVAEIAAFIANQSGRTPDAVDRHLRWF